MSFKESIAEYQLLSLALIEPDPQHARQHVDEAALKGLVNSISRKGLIHPLVVQPANREGKYRLIVGERRRQAAMLAGEALVPVLIRACEPNEVLELQVFENLGLGSRAALEPRDMANAIQRIAERFGEPEAAAEQFGRSSTWLNQATAAANLSPKVSALLDSRKLTSTATALQIEKLAQKDVGRADSLIGQIEQLPEGERLPRKVVDQALIDAGVRRPKKVADEPEVPVESKVEGIGNPAENVTPSDPSEAVSDVSPSAGFSSGTVTMDIVPSSADRDQRRRVNSTKVRRVAEILGLSTEDEDEVLDRLIDDFLASRAGEFVSR